MVVHVWHAALVRSGSAGAWQEQLVPRGLPDEVLLSLLIYSLCSRPTPHASRGPAPTVGAPLAEPREEGERGRCVGPSAPRHSPRPACWVGRALSLMCFQETCSFCKLFSKSQLWGLIITSSELLFGNLFTSVWTKIVSFLCSWGVLRLGLAGTPWWGWGLPVHRPPPARPLPRCGLAALPPSSNGPGLDIVGLFPTAAVSLSLCSRFAHP